MQYIIVFFLLFIGVIESIRRCKLTVAGAVAGGFIGFFVFIGAGYTGLVMLTAFFLLGTWATSWKRKQKEATAMAHESGGRRTLGQVLANGGVSGLLGLLTLFFPDYRSLFSLLIAGALSAAMADTLSSELGTLYGTKFYNIITFQRDKKGLDGVISLEGTLIGIAGSSIIALIYCTGFGWSANFLWIVMAGTFGNLADSVLGATLERKALLGNDAVNLLNTLLGALLLLLQI